MLAAEIAASPSWTDKVTAIGTAAVAAGLLVTAIGAWFAFDQVREAWRDRHIQVISDFSERWDQPLMSEARELASSLSSEDLAAAVAAWIAGPADPAVDVPKLLRVPNFFEDLAMMVECGRLEVSYIARSFGSSARGEWGYWEKAITTLRREQEDVYVEFEKLVRDLERAARPCT